MYASLPSEAHPGALAAALAEISRAARSAALGPVKRGAKILLAEPWRLELVLPGMGEKDPNEVLAAVRARKEIMRDLGRRGHYAYDANRMLALRQAYVAVRTARLRERAARRAPLSAHAAADLAAHARAAAKPPEKILDLPSDRALPLLLEERERLRAAIGQARARLREIEALIARKPGAG